MASPTPVIARSPSSRPAPRCTPSSPRTSTGCTRPRDRRPTASSRSTATSMRSSAWRADGAARCRRPSTVCRAGEEDPACLECGGMLKSATISFGENLVVEDLRRAEQATRGADVFVAAGTSLGVYPAAGLPEIAFRARGASRHPQRRADAVRPLRRRGARRAARRRAPRDRRPDLMAAQHLGIPDL